MDTTKIIKSIFNEIVKEVNSNKDFKQRLTDIIENEKKKISGNKRKSPRRIPGPFDPIEVFQQQPNLLESKLDALDIKQLKDIIAEHGMDRSRLAMKWKKKDRLVQLIIESVKSRVQKGEEFRKTKFQDEEMTKTEAGENSGKES